MEHQRHSPANGHGRSVIVPMRLRYARTLAAAGLLAASTFAGQTLRESRTGMEFVRIPPGQFRMGCSDGDDLCDPDEKPVHDVRITNEFEIGKYEVTQEQWRRVIQENPSTFTGDNRP